ncbi:MULTISPECIES: hypothetical protein [Bacillus]|uniref:Uncharacterized protein n=2 Tax=Bacillus thuringiensis TaxID=1428 RepID=A0A9X6Z5R7_BACTU|nr:MULTISPECIES: hypothetical protein [Bacillus]AFV21965.1 hypothetical protein BTB_502p06600 [Bacillus thuringiensis Bt407]EEM25013.1 hypothetical protein bthur0002_56550 [Bacillus thuringiensis Bt407]ERI00857.1 hypothetical protein BTCBT_002412 [Bacillus thuringiensis T01-328]MBN6707632.1 hypothetical protein [Bacillus thuringiensis]MCU5281281.1 hypothetical protein [Bacillus cereus]
MTEAIERKHLSVKNGIMAFFLTLVMMMGFGLPVMQAHAEGQIGDVEVKVGSDGKLELSGGGMSNTSNSGSAWTNFINKYRNFIVGISGIGAVSMIMFFIFQFMKLGASAGNPQARSQALTGLIWSGIAAAGLTKWSPASEMTKGNSW